MANENKEKFIKTHLEGIKKFNDSFNKNKNETNDNNRNKKNKK